MTRDEANKLHELFNNVVNVTVISDWVAGTTSLSTIDCHNKYIVRTFTIDAAPVQQHNNAPTINTASGTQTITFPTTPAGQIFTFVNGTGGSLGISVIPGPDAFKPPVSVDPKELKCCCGADKCGGLHSSWCDKGDVK